MPPNPRRRGPAGAARAGRGDPAAGGRRADGADAERAVADARRRVRLAVGRCGGGRAAAGRRAAAAAHAAGRPGRRRRRPRLVGGAAGIRCVCEPLHKQIAIQPRSRAHRDPTIPVRAEHLEQPLVHAVDFFAAVCRSGLPAGAPRGATQGSSSPSNAVAKSPAITGDLLGCSGN